LTGYRQPRPISARLSAVGRPPAGRPFATGRLACAPPPAPCADWPYPPRRTRLASRAGPGRGRSGSPAYTRTSAPAR